MLKTNKPQIVLLAIIIVLAAVYIKIKQGNELFLTADTNNANQVLAGLFHNADFKPKDLYTGLASTSPIEPITDKVYGGIVSRHFFVEPTDDISILSFGDMMFGRRVGEFISQGNDPFEQIEGVGGNFLKGADFIAGNLEGPITTAEHCQQKPYSFKFATGTAALLRRHNINLVNLANNHFLDCYQAGLDDTREYLRAAGIDYFGDHDPGQSFLIKKINGFNIAFAGIDYFGIADINQFYELVSRLKKDNDFVLVNIHWGPEYQSFASTSQRDVGHKLIDSGADVIIGHHPHVIQNMEIYKDKPIFYSLGNFIFDQDFSPETSAGFAVGAVLGKGKSKFYLFPYEIKNFSPQLLPYQQAEKFCANFLSGVKASDTCQFELN